jgi:hypothetical protein
MADVIKLEDVIHFYVGCEFGTIRKGKEGMLIDRIISACPEQKTIHSSNWENFNYDDTKPILRSLSSMTEDEASEIWRLLDWNERINPANRAAEIIAEFSPIELDDETTQNTHWGNLIKILPYLLSRGFDLFNLIENDLAIDATLNQQTMTPVTLLPDVLAVEVPLNADQFEISVQDDGTPSLTYFSHENIDPTVVCLPPGSYEIIGPVLSLSEEQAAQVVQSMNPFITGKVYKDYQTGYFESATALESLSSLLKSKGLEGNQLLIRKLK